MKIKIVAAALMAASAYFYYRKTTDSSASAIDEIESALNDTTQQAAEIIDNFTGGSMKLSAMANVTRNTLAATNVQAFLRVIRRGEGTADAAGYRRIFGGSMFSSMAEHPRKTIKTSRYTSSAAGAYQFIISTWDETARIMGLHDFSELSQDMGAVGRIAARGALDDVLAGRFDAAIRKCAKEWASLPYSPYGQPTISMATAAAVYASNGGSVNA